MEEVKTMMKHLSNRILFLLLLIKRSQFKRKKPNYENGQFESIKSFGINSPTQFSVYVKLRSGLMKNPFLRYFLGNIAFLKNPRKSLLKYFVLEDKKLIYLRIFKNGSTSILKSILPELHKSLQGVNLSDKEIDLLGHRLEKNKLPRGHEDYTVFTVVRNPLERIVSAYLDVLADGDYDDFLFGIFRKNMSFKEVVMLLAKIPDHLRGPHFTSQYEIIKSTKSTSVVSFKLGSENEKLKEFLSSFSLSIAHNNKSKIEYDFRKYYDIETLELVYNIYREDFNMLDFKSEFNELKTLLKTKAMVDSSQPIQRQL